jgi:putative ABC transport system ATP-binding protein
MASTSSEVVAPVEAAGIPHPGSAAAARVRLEGITKQYGEGDVAVHALRGINVEVSPGQLVVLLGPSGSGKTTLLNIVGGLEAPDAGRVVVGERDIVGLDEPGLTDYRRAEVGFVFQFFNLVATLTAAENVALVAELVGEDGEDAPLRALRAVGLEDRADHFPSALSGGEQQRVAIARALVKQPTLLLADEPTGSLDLDTGRQVLAALRAAARPDGCTVLLVTHNSAIAAMADRVLRMGSGQLLDDHLQPVPAPVEEVTW